MGYSNNSINAGLGRRSMDSRKMINSDIFINIVEYLNDGVALLDTQRKIFYWNQGAVGITGFTKAEILEHKCSENILIPKENGDLQICKNECPVDKTIQDGKIRSFEAYFHHKEGYRFPVFMRTMPIMDKEQRIIGAVETFYDTSPKVLIPQKAQELRKMNLLDPLTEMGNKSYLDAQIMLKLEEMNKHHFPLGILLIDIDRFNATNETHGTVVGDKILRMVARTLANNIRFYDIVGRWAGEQFLVLIFNIQETKLDLVANKLRLLISQSNIQVGTKLLSVTVSIGATMARLSDNTRTIMERVDRLMQHSKNEGRNRVSITLDD
jgi:diguanylate cyclase (GGDEF)-like protein/PAS domain S-box-containing protein